MRHLLFIITLLMTILLWGCSSVHYLELNPQLDKKPIYDPLPLAIGVYKSPAFLNREENLFFHHPLVFPLGKSSSALLDQVLAAMFARTIPVTPENSKLLVSQHKLAGILEINIVNFTWESGYHGEEGIMLIEEDIYNRSITYQVKLTDSSGIPVADWTFTGSVKAKSDWLCGSWVCTFNDSIKFMERKAEFLMLDAMARFMVDFYAKPEIKHWLEKYGVVVESAP